MLLNFVGVQQVLQLYISALRRVGEHVEVLESLPVSGDLAWRPGVVVHEARGLGSKAMLDVSLSGSENSTQVIHKVSGSSALPVESHCSPQPSP